MPSAPHINADILNQIRGSSQHKAAQEVHFPSSINSQAQHNSQPQHYAVPKNVTQANSLPDDIQAAMAKQHHTLHDGSFMPDGNSRNEMMQPDPQGNPLMRKGSAPSSQQPQFIPGGHNVAIAEPYEVKVLNQNPNGSQAALDVQPQQMQGNQNSMQEGNSRKQPLNDVDLQRRISRLQGSGGKFSLSFLTLPSLFR